MVFGKIRMTRSAELYHGVKAIILVSVLELNYLLYRNRYMLWLLDRPRLNAQSYQCVRDTFCTVGPLAQRLEQRTHNPLVEGSNPSGPTNFFNELTLNSTWRQSP